MKFLVSKVANGWPRLKSDLDRLGLTALKPEDDLTVAYDRSGNLLLKGLIYDASNKRQPASRSRKDRDLAGPCIAAAKL